jgi:Domain of unknown function (DUF5069)
MAESATACTLIRKPPHEVERRSPWSLLRTILKELKARVQEGGTDHEILEWCFANGRRLDKNDIEIWNGFISKLGWNDSASDYLAKCKAEAGLADRDDIQTVGHLCEVEEGRKP